MEFFDRFIFEPDKCEYLGKKISTMEYAAALSLSGAEYEDLLNSGWRKFGFLLFHPICKACSRCRPIRIQAKDFQPNRSQRRNMKKNADLTVKFGEPEVDDARLALYYKYHKSREEKKGWNEAHQLQTDEYTSFFLENPVPMMEVSLWEKDILRGIVLTDVTPNVISDIYHFYEPEIPERGFGTFGLIQTIDLALSMKKQFVHFGYFVPGCPSMMYKANYRPSEIVDFDGTWKFLEDTAFMKDMDNIAGDKLRNQPPLPISGFPSRIRHRRRR